MVDGKSHNSKPSNELGNNDTVSVALVLPEAEVATVVATVEANGGQRLAEAESYEPPDDVADLFGDQQFEPLTVIALTLSAAFLLARISRVWSDLKHPKGLLVDARVVPAQIVETESLDRGNVVIFFEDHTESYTRDEKDAALEALQKIFVSTNG